MADDAGSHSGTVAGRVASLLSLRGDERALDAGTGTGALALALAPLVREVVGVDAAPERLDEARKGAPANAEFVEGDATALPFPDASFDVVGTVGMLHHVRRPELALAELTRVLRPGGTMLVVDELAPDDPLAAIELNRLERARESSTSRVLADVDLRGLFDANGLVLARAERFRDSGAGLGAYVLRKPALDR